VRSISAAEPFPAQFGGEQEMLVKKTDRVSGIPSDSRLHDCPVLDVSAPVRGSGRAARQTAILIGDIEEVFANLNDPARTAGRDEQETESRIGSN
jgi:hypothetical protein